MRVPKTPSPRRRDDCRDRDGNVALMLTMFSIRVRPLCTGAAAGDLSRSLPVVMRSLTTPTQHFDGRQNAGESVDGRVEYNHSLSSTLTTGVYAVPTSLWTPTITSTSSSTWTVVPPSNATMVSSSPSDLPSINAIQPGFPIAVRVSGNFKMMFPTLLYVSPTIPMNSMVILTCEGT